VALTIIAALMATTPTTCMARKNRGRRYGNVDNSLPELPHTPTAQQQQLTRYFSGSPYPDAKEVYVLRSFG